MDHCATLQSLQPNTTSSYVDLAVSPNQLATFLQGQGTLLGLLTSPYAGELQSLGRAGCSCLFPVVLGTSFPHPCIQNVTLSFGTNECEIDYFIVAETRFVLLWPVKDKTFFFFFISACSLKLLLFPTVSNISDVAWWMLVTKSINVVLEAFPLWKGYIPVLKRMNYSHHQVSNSKSSSEHLQKLICFNKLPL